MHNKLPIQISRLGGKLDFDKYCNKFIFKFFAEKRIAKKFFDEEIFMSFRSADNHLIMTKIAPNTKVINTGIYANFSP